MATIIINGQSFSVSGDNANIVSRNGQIIVNQNVLSSGLSGDVRLVIEGVVANIEADGSVTCGDVRGNVNAGGSVRSGNVESSVSAGGSVTAAKVAGNISAGGSVRVGG